MKFRPAFIALSSLPAVFFAAVLHAQALPPGVELGMRTEALRAAMPTIERVARPVRIAGGLSGTWRGEPVVLGGLPFEPTFYTYGGELRRVEWVAQPGADGDRGAAAYAELVGWGRARFGTEMASRDPGSELASWVAGEADVYAQRVDDPRRAGSVRLVYKLRQIKDASQL